MFFVLGVAHSKNRFVRVWFPFGHSLVAGSFIIRVLHFFPLNQVDSFCQLVHALIIWLAGPSFWGTTTRTTTNYRRCYPVKCELTQLFLRIHTHILYFRQNIQFQSKSPIERGVNRFRLVLCGFPKSNLKIVILVTLSMACLPVASAALTLKGLCFYNRPLNRLPFLILDTLIALCSSDQSGDRGTKRPDPPVVDK